MKSQICTKCQREQPSINFHKTKTNKRGTVSCCKKCVATKSHFYYIHNKNIINSKNRIWREINKESEQIRKRHYYQKNKKEINQKIWSYTKALRQKKILNKECLYCPQIATHGQVCKNHKILTTNQGKRYRFLLKKEVFNHYGNRCVCCGETHTEFLTIDHINGGGNKHRKELFGKDTKGGTYMYAWLKKNNFPQGYQLLCMNCNFAKGHFSGCPHKISA